MSFKNLIDNIPLSKKYAPAGVFRKARGANRMSETEVGQVGRTDLLLPLGTVRGVVCSQLGRCHRTHTCFLMSWQPREAGKRDSPLAGRES